MVGHRKRAGSMVGPGASNDVAAIVGRSSGEHCSRVGWWLIGLALASLAAACSSSEAREPSPAEARGGPPAVVEVVEAKRQVFVERADIPANVLPFKQVKIIPRVPGRLEKVLVDEGDPVREGQVVATLEQRDYRLAVKQARAALAAAESGVKLASIGVHSAETAYQRMKELRQNGAIPQSEMDKVSDGQQAGLAKLAAARAQLQLARVGLASARTKLADTVLRAPFAGVVLTRLLDEGEVCQVMPPAVVMVIGQVDPMKVVGAIGERERRLVKIGTPATVRIDGLPGETFEARVEHVSPSLDPVTRTAKVRVLLPNPDRRLEAGMSARLELDLGQREVVAVPSDAVIRGSAADRGVLFVVDDRGRAHRREVVLGTRQGGLVEVRQGLEAGETVVRSGQAGLQDGAPVEVSTHDGGGRG